MFSNGYITKEVLTSCGLMVLVFDLEGLNKEGLVEDLAADYSKSYIDDDIISKINFAYGVVKVMVPSLFNDPSFNDEHYAEICKRLIKLISNYKTDGRKRGLLKGTFFMKNKQPVTDVEKEVQKLLMMYYLNIKSGKVNL